MFFYWFCAWLNITVAVWLVLNVLCLIRKYNLTFGRYQGVIIWNAILVSINLTAAIYNVAKALT